MTKYKNKSITIVQILWRKPVIYFHCFIKVILKDRDLLIPTLLMPEFKIVSKWVKNEWRMLKEPRFGLN